MRRGRIGLADIGVLALLTALAVGTAFLQNRHQPLALYDQNIRATIGAQIDAFARKMMSRFRLCLARFARPICCPQSLYGHGAGPLSAGLYGATIQLYRPRPCHIANPQIRLQDVYLVDDRGTSHKARYMMQKQPDGSWKIAGCQLLASNQMDI